MHISYVAKYQHDCDDCVFLGHFQGSDLYFHPSVPTLVARRSSEEPDYVSGLYLVGVYPELGVALGLAVDRKLLSINEG